MAKDKQFMAGLLFCLLCLLPFPTHAKETDSFHISLAVSPRVTRVFSLKVVDNPGLMREILRAPTQKTRLTPEFPRATIRMGGRTFLYDFMGRMFEPAKKRMVLLTANVHDSLLHYIMQAERQYYGQLLVWDVVRKHFSRMRYAEVIDLETGERFRVQRRAGSRHADVQPLTRQDTDTMKRIYQGKWSWRRRAILVVLDNKAYAASMHGMPHGAGAIANNGFDGHFCIHFAGSTTHRRSEPDPSHSLMIMKAAGMLPAQLMAAEPHQLVEWFLTALHEQDETILRMFDEEMQFLPFDWNKLEAFRLDEKEVPVGEVSLVSAQIPVKVHYLTKGRTARAETWHFYLNRSSFLERWKITEILVFRQ